MDQALYEKFNAVEQYHWWMVARRRIIRTLIERAVPAGSSLLEIGCGTGALLAELQARYRVTGVDMAPEAIRFCREKGLTDVHVGGVADPLPDPGRRFDAVLLLDVIEHLDDDQAAMVVARERLREGGLLFVTVPAYRFLWSQHDVINHHRRRYTARMLRATLERGGFRIRRLSYFNSLMFPAAVLELFAARWTGRERRRAERQYDFSPGLFNDLLRTVFAFERRLLPHISFPYGVSLLAITER